MNVPLRKEIVIPPKPNLLYLENLLEPAVWAKARLSTIASKSNARDEDETIRQGLYVLAVSHIETMLTATLKYYLTAFPQKIEKEAVNVSKRELLEHSYDLIESQVERLVWSAAYKPIVELVEFFCDTLSLEVDAQTLALPLIEIKAKRNTLLHNNFRNGGASFLGDELSNVSIDRDYLASTVEEMMSFIDQVISLISAKYREYTRLAAIKRLWAYTFSSPIMRFEDYWEIDEDDDCIRARKQSVYDPRISENEVSFLDLWYTHWGGHHPARRAVSMTSLDHVNATKVLHLLWAFRQFSIQPVIRFREEVNRAEFSQSSVVETKGHGNPLLGDER